MVLKGKLRLSALKAIRWMKAKEKSDAENTKPSNLKRSRSGTSGNRKSWMYSRVKARAKTKEDNCNSSGESFGSGLEHVDSMQHTRSSLRLDELINDQEALEAFTRFCRSQYAVENLLFWLQAEKFRKQNSKVGLENANKEALKEPISEAREVYDRFLKSNADDWVCVQTETINRIESNLTKDAEKLDPNLFVKAQEETLRTVEGDLIPRFIKSAVVGSDFEISGKVRSNLLGLLHENANVVAVN